MKNTTMFMLIALVAMSIIGFMFVKGGPTTTGNVIVENPTALQGEVQKVVIGEQNSNYYPDTINVKAGQPVEITLDNSVKGCLRSFTIRDLGVQKYAKTPEDKITFTPSKKGSFTFACVMGMGYGTINVE